MGTYMPVRPTKYCHACGRVIDAAAVVCPPCGVLQPDSAMPGVSEKRIVPALLLCFFFGIFGAHRFYVGKTGTAIIQLFTLGGCGIWTLVDFIMIVVGEFKDKAGNKLMDWV
jgi:TM2 domain-containing membrane protein YozV